MKQTLAIVHKRLQATLLLQAIPLLSGSKLFAQAFRFSILVFNGLAARKIPRLLLP